MVGLPWCGMCAQHSHSGHTALQASPGAGPVARELYLGAALLVSLVVVYYPALDGGLLWDDGDQFANVRQFADPNGIWRLVLPVRTAQYYPLSMLAFWALRQVFGLWTPAYHLLNLALHAGNVLLLWALLARLDRRWAWVGAGWYALHPVLTPAVAWMCQLRNLLSVHLALWTVWHWLRYETTSNRAAYRRAVLCFVLAMLAKTAVAPLPLLLALAGHWLRPLRQRWVALAPLVAAALVLSIVTVVYEAVDASGPRFAAGANERFARMGWIAWFDLKQAAFPWPTAFVYPRWQIAEWGASAYLPSVAGLCLLALAWFSDRRARTGLALCLTAYFLMLGPVLGWFNVVFMQYALVADHWQYPALPALAAGMVLALGRWAPRAPSARWVTVAAVLLLGFWGTLTHQRARLFDQMELLWQDTLIRNPNCWLAHNNYGAWLEEQGRLAAAGQHLAAAHRIAPTDHRTLINLGRLARHQGDDAQAERWFREAIRVRPRAPEPLWCLTSLKLAQGQAPAALEAAQSAFQLAPHSAAAFDSLGAAYGALGRTAEAETNLRRALELEPRLTSSHENLAAIEITKGHVESAIEHLSAVIQLQPDRAEAHFGLGCAWALQGDRQRAVAHYRRALALRPRWAEPANNLAEILATDPDPAQRRPDEAVALAEMACAETNRGQPALLATLAICLHSAGRAADAHRTAGEALRLAQTQGPTGLAEAIQKTMATWPPVGAR